MKKRILATVLAAVMALSLLPATALAAPRYEEEVVAETPMGEEAQKNPQKEASAVKAAPAEIEETPAAELLEETALPEGASKIQLENGVSITGIAGLNGLYFDSMEHAYNAFNTILSGMDATHGDSEAGALGQGQLLDTPNGQTAQEKFDAVYTQKTELEGHQGAKLTWTIYGEVNVSDTLDSCYLSGGRKAAWYGSDSMTIREIEIVGGDASAKLVMSKGPNMPYQWWGDTTDDYISLKIKGVTLSPAGGQLGVGGGFRTNFDYTIEDCTVNGTIYFYFNGTSALTVKDCTFVGGNQQYAFFAQGHVTQPLTINFEGNTVSGYKRGINIDQVTAQANITGNTITPGAGYSAIQISGCKTANIEDNTIHCNGGNVLTFHENLAKNSVDGGRTITLKDNEVDGNGYLIYDDIAAAGNYNDTNTYMNLVMDGNTIPATIDTAHGIKGETVTDTKAQFVAVAQVGEKFYSSLQAAIDAADGKTVKLLKDVTAPEVMGFAINKSVTIDGAYTDAEGNQACHTVTALENTGTGRAFDIKQSNGLKATFKNLKIDAAKANRGISAYQAANLELTLENVEITCDHYAVYIASDCTDAKVNVTGSTIQGYAAINVWSKSTIDVTDSTLIGYNKWDGEGDNGFSTIVFTGNTDPSASRSNGSKLTATNSTVKTIAAGTATEKILAFQGPDMADVSATFTGCTFESYDDAECTEAITPAFYVDELIKTGNTLTIDGETYGINADMGNISLTEIKDKAVAECGGVKYATLAEAVAAATDGQTVKLVKQNDQVTGTGVMLKAADAKNVTIDLNGCTYNVVAPHVGSTGYESQSFHFEKGNTVTLKNGTIKSGAPIVIQNYCDLTLEDLTIEGAEGAQYAVSCNAGNTTLTNVSISGIENALDVMHWHGQYPTAPTMTINNTADNTIGGKIDVYCYGNGADACESKATLEITGGTFTVNVSAYCAEGYQATENNGTWSVAVIPAPDPTPSVTYYTLTIRYVDGEGNEVAPSYTARLSRSSRYNVASPEVEGMVPDQETVSGVMGREDLTVTVTYAANEQLVDPDVPLASGVFIDVAAGDWFAAAVSSVYTKELMVGVTANTFAPKALTTRSMVATILHRMESEPTAAAADFSDVLDGAWYAPAVNWANETGLMIGAGNGAFGAEDHITREQLALTFYRYAQFKGQDVTTSGDLSAFADGAETSDWAKEAMTWAVESGLFQGKGQNILDPKADLTRAELAAILDRFFAEEK